MRKLRDALTGFDAIVWLAVPIPQVRSVLHRLKAGRRLDAAELTKLIDALDRTSSAPGARSGRPMELRTAVVRAGCIAWFRAGRKLSRTWDPLDERVVGPLASFVRDLLDICDLEMSDAALSSALQTALLHIQNHPTLCSAWAAHSAKAPDFPS